MFWIDFLIFLFACMAAGLTGSLFPPGKWYSDLNKPRWTPPNWIFPVAWPILYILMSYSGATLANLENSGSALALWALQIAINTLWTPVFFWIKEYKTRFNDYTFFISLCVDFHMRLLVIFIIGRSSVFAIFSLGSIRRDTKCCCI